MQRQKRLMVGTKVNIMMKKSYVKKLDSQTGKSKVKKQMENKVNCLMRILTMLEANGQVSNQSLMDEFNCSERTAFRYIKALRDGGQSIDFNQEKRVYSFQSGFSPRKLDLSPEETLTFTLARTAMKGMGPEIEESLNRVEKKLSAKKGDLQRNLVYSTDPQGPKFSGHLGAIMIAMENRQRISLVYRSLHEDVETTRVVDPYYVYVSDGFWLLRAFCRLRNEPRSFALDKIVALKVLDEYFISTPEVEPIDELSGAFGSFIDGDPVEVVLRFDAEIRAQVMRKRWHKSQTETELKDGRLEMKFNVNGIEGIKQWIYRWLPYVVVVGPKELKREIMAELKESTRKNL